MKLTVIFLLLFTFSFTSVIFSQAPTTRITAPSHLSTFLVGMNLLITATASDADGTIDKVEFYQDMVKLGEDNISPYEYNWASVSAGTYVLTVKAYDNAGNVTTSTTVRVTFHPADFVSNIKYYVKAGASNMNDGLSPEKPFPTIQKAANLTNPGDTVFVMDGTYTNACPQCQIVGINRTGTAAGYIVYTNYPGHFPVLSFNGWGGLNISGSASYLVIRGFEIRGNNANITLEQALNQPGSCSNPGTVDPIYNGNGIFIDGRKSGAHKPHHLIIEKNRVHDCGGAGIGSAEADYMTIQDNVVYNNCWYSIYGTSGITHLNLWNYDTNTGYRNFTRRNKCYGNRMYLPFIGNCKIEDGNGIIIDRNDGSISTSGLPQYNGRTLVENNLIYNNGGSGIHAFRSSHVDIINNTAYHNSQSEETTGDIFAIVASDVFVLNNIIIPIPGQSASFKNGTNITFDYNNYFGAASAVSGAHDVIADPKFINPVIGDFRLQATSPAIDKGTATTSPIKDISGAPRPRGLGFDIGAYEYKTPYTFTGNGNWSIATNWLGQLIPPNPLSNNDTVVINSATDAILNVNYNIEAGSVLKNTGIMSVSQGVTINVMGDLNNNGVLIINGSVSKFTFTNNGIVKGTGRFIGNFTNGTGTLAPGTSPGKFTIEGDYNNGNNGILEMELGGDNPETEYDVLNVTGSTTLDGILKVNFINDYYPEEDKSYDVINGNSAATGAFDEINWSSDYNGSVSNNENLVTISMLEPLPIELIDFIAQASKRIVELKWRTATEKNNKGFYVERSSDGIKWGNITFVNGKGNTNAVTGYRYNDLGAKSGINYYRLKQMDFDGKFAYSPIVSAYLETVELTIYPNPTSGIIEVKGLKNTQVIVKITDILGKIIQNYTLTNGQSIDLQNQPSGVYFIEIQEGNRSVINKVVKN